MSDGKSGSSFSRDEERALAGVLDEIIPPSTDGRLPGAGELGLAGYIGQAVKRAPDQRDMILRALTVIDDLAGSRGSTGFAALAKADRVEVLNEAAAKEPAFLPGLIFHVYAGYYQNDRVVEALGIESWPPHPDGYKLGPDAPGLIDAVRQRGHTRRKG
jgi:hypothetical protein